MPENCPAPVTRMRVPRGRKVGSADTTPPWVRVPARVIPLRANAVASTRYGPLVAAGSKADPKASIAIAKRNDFIGNSSINCPTSEKDDTARFDAASRAQREQA